jgi:hypothetical protein
MPPVVVFGKGEADLMIAMCKHSDQGSSPLKKGTVPLAGSNFAENSVCGRGTVPFFNGLLAVADVLLGRQPHFPVASVTIFIDAELPRTPLGLFLRSSLSQTEMNIP